MSIYLKALSLKNYRGIGSDIQVMANFKTFNFFIGANNAGKSTILNFISRYLPVPTPHHGQSSAALHALEEHQHEGFGQTISMAIGFSEEDAGQFVLDRHHAKLPPGSLMRQTLIKVIKLLSDDNGLIWTGCKLPYRGPLSITHPDLATLKPKLHQREWEQLWNSLTQQNGGGILEHWIPEIINAINASLDTSLPQVSLIPAIREIGPKGANFDDFSGVGLIDRLAAIQNPEHNRRDDRVMFDKINGFLQFVTGRSDAEIEIPHSRDYILVHMNGRTLPLASLGTGIQEVIMIASFCTIVDEKIICIEEPKIHLHPLLQRKLMVYLATETKNQYFIATHSASFIDTPAAAIFHVTLENGTTHIREAVLRKDRFAICTDLGHRASDIVQSNAVIWVEGPSDRIYLRHWISIADPQLAEGIHYSIMFYGGRLLSQLSADDEEVTEFIQLRSLNRNIAIMIDSDKTSGHSKINATKQRLLSEFERHGSIAWITKGREIENYIEYSRLQAAVSKVYANSYDCPCFGGPFDHALFFQRKSPKRRRKGPASIDLIERQIDKVKVSRTVVEDGKQTLESLDLKERISALVQMIRRANA